MDGYSDNLMVNVSETIYMNIEGSVINLLIIPCIDIIQVVLRWRLVE